MKDKLDGQIMKKIIGYRSKTYSYLNDNNVEHKKAKGTKTCVIKRKPTFKDYKNSLEVAQLENKINHLQKSKIDLYTLEKDQKQFIKANKLILKTQQRFRSEKHNIFTEEINEIALSSNDNKKMQSTHLVEIYAYKMNKDLVNKKKQIKLNNIIKQYKNV